MVDQANCRRLSVSSGGEGGPPAGGGGCGLSEGRPGAHPGRPSGSEAGSFPPGGPGGGPFMSGGGGGPSKARNEVENPSPGRMKRTIKERNSVFIFKKEGSGNSSDEFVRINTQEKSSDSQSRTTSPTIFVSRSRKIL